MNNKHLYILLGVIQIFVAFGAIPVGLMMIITPDGSTLSMPLSLLKNSPFPNFFIPGLFLFCINGLFNLFGGILSFKKHKFSPILSLGLGIILMMWISIQVYFITFNSFLQPLFFLIGLIELMLGIILFKNQKKF